MYTEEVCKLGWVTDQDADRQSLYHFIVETPRCKHVAGAAACVSNFREPIAKGKKAKFPIYSRAPPRINTRQTQLFENCSRFWGIEMSS